MGAYLVASPCYHFHLHQSSRNRFVLRWSGSVFLSLNDFVFYCDGRTFPGLLRSVIIWKWIKMIHKNVRCQIWKCKLKSLMEGYFFWKKKMLLNEEYHPEKLCCWLVAFICYHWSWLCASQDTDFNLFRMQLLKFYPRFEEKKGSCHSSYSITSAGYELLSENILGFSSW